MIREKLIRLKDLTLKQMEFIASHLLTVPGTIRMTFETIPSFKILGEDGNEEIIFYEPGQGIDSFMDTWAKYFSDTDGDVYTEWDRRMIIYIWGRDLEDTQKGIHEESDQQSMWPVGSDVWSSRMEDCFQTCIAPLAILLPSTWSLYAMQVDPKSKWHHVPDGVGGKGRSTAEAVWTAIGGKINHLIPNGHAASDVQLDEWNLSTYEEWMEVIPEVLAHIRQELGEDRYKELRELPAKVFHKHDIPRKKKKEEDDD